MSNTRVRLRNGREVGIAAFGDPVAQRVVVMCHPTPGAALFDPDPIVTNRWGVHIVAVDRPGYGGSPELPDGSHHSLRERADDIAQLLAHDERIANQISPTDLRTFGVVGWGTGAVVAAAIAERHPDLVDRLALVSAPAPRKAAKLARRPFALPHTREALHIDEDDPAFDRHLGLRGRLDRMLDEAYRQDTAGIDGDRQLIANTAWIDGLAHVSAPTLLLTGSNDPVIDDEDVRWWTRHLPSVLALTSPASAALTIADAWEDVLQHLAPAHGHIEEGLRDHGQPLLPQLPTGEHQAH